MGWTTGFDAQKR